ncbi:epoxide hydrolase N-terminal domain-containing protein [Pedobacter aquatilis]|uniref:epoxide hydrolase N-terminal domain-containing protein n=1 Tax=Pedobacter aquatilis TaxID=351343 RepID=UPI002931A9D4|nr:epoxide hydrolase N-terminal domain-containing protein [Pedobacter aquatilis]
MPALTTTLIFFSASTFAQSVNKEKEIDQTIKPFHASFPKEKLDDLKQRIKQTVWPEIETVKDQSQGVQLATMKKLAEYWDGEYDWSKIETKLNSLPQFCLILI